MGTPHFLVEVMVIVAGGKKSEDYAPDPEAEEPWERAHRTDLDNVFGFMLSVPWHGQDAQGNLIYGRQPMYGWANSELSKQFELDMRSILVAEATYLVSNGLLTENQANSIQGHHYSIGPAVQEWPNFFFEFYKDVRPIISDGASWFGWGVFLKSAYMAVRSWSSRKRQEAIESTTTEELAHDFLPDVLPILTRPDIIALCYTNLLKRYGIGEDVVIDTFPRSFTDYSRPEHPGGRETYLVRLRAGRRNFFYLVDAKGIVTEHYLATGQDLTLLPMPMLFDGMEDNLSPRDPQPSQRVKINTARAEPT